MAIIPEILQKLLGLAPKLEESAGTAAKYVKRVEPLSGVSRAEVEAASRVPRQEVQAVARQDTPIAEGITKSYSPAEEFGTAERVLDDAPMHNLEKGLSDESDIPIAGTTRRAKPKEYNERELISESVGRPEKEIKFSHTIDDIAKDIDKADDEPSMFTKLSSKFEKDELGRREINKNIAKEYLNDLSDIMFKPGSKGERGKGFKMGDISDTYYETKRIGSSAYGKTAQYVEDVEKPFLMKLNTPHERKIANHIMHDEHMLERINNKQGIAGITPQDIYNRLELYKQKLGPQRYQEVREAAAKFVRDASAYRKLHATAEGEGKLTDAATFDAWEKKYKWYVPSVHSDDLLKEAFGDSAAYSKGGITGVRLDFMKSAGNRVFEPDYRSIERLREGTARMFMTQERIKVNRIAAREFGVPINFEKRAVKKMVRDPKTNKMVEKTEIINFPINLPKGYVLAPNVITATGKAHNQIYAFPKEVADVLSQIGKKQADLITDAMGNLNRAWKEMATAYRLPFTLMNVFRDTHDAIMNERLAEAGINIPSVFMKPSVIIKAFWSSFRKNVLGGFDSQFSKSILKDEWYDEAIKEGLPFGGRFSGGGLQEQPFHLLDWKKKSYRVVTYPLSFLHDMSVAAEQGWRLAQYKRFEGTGVSKAMRVGLGRDITVDFDKMGHSTRVINKFIPFFNANLQGYVNIANNFKTQPKTTAVKMFGFLTVMSSVYLYSKLNDADDFEKVDPYLKDNYWLMNSGLKNKGRPYYISVAGLPRSATAIWSTVRRAIDLYVEKNPDKKDEMQKNLIESFTSSNLIRPFFSSNLPPALKTPMEMFTNYDIFRGRNIEPASTEGLSPEFRSRPSTPNMYRRIAQGMADMPITRDMGASPAKLAHGISGAMPAIRQIESPIDFVLDKMLGTDNLLDPMKKDEVSDIDNIAKVVPFIKGTHYDPDLEKAYLQLRKENTTRKDKMYLAREYYDAWKAGDDEAEAKYKLIYRNLDASQRKAMTTYHKNKKMEERLGRAGYKIAKAPLAVRRAILQNKPITSAEEIFESEDNASSY